MRGTAPETGGLAYHEIMTLAVYRLGGVSQRVDTEDAAIEASKLAPGRFAWKKYPEQINLELVRVSLSDAKKPDKGSYLTGTGTTGWMLTPAGLKFAETRITDLAGLAAPAPDKERLKREQFWFRKEAARMLDTPAYRKAADGRIRDVTEREAERFFRVDAFVQGEVRFQKIDRLLNAFREHAELGPVLDALRALVPSGEEPT